VTLSNLYRQYLAKLPVCVRSCVERLLDPVRHNRPSAARMLDVIVPNHDIRFPTCFPALYRFFLEYRFTPAHRQPDTIRRSMPLILHFDDESFDLVFPLLLRMFSEPTSRVMAIELFDQIAMRLGQMQTRLRLMVPALHMFEVNDDHLKQKLLGQFFMSRLIGRFTLTLFVEHFVDHLLEHTAHTTMNVAKTAARTLQYLVSKHGVIFAMRFVVRPLLRHFPKPSVVYVVETLAAMANQFGEDFITNAYFPYFVSQVCFCVIVSSA
jgi:hypothetical protein